MEPGTDPVVVLDGDLDIVTSIEVKRRLAALVEEGADPVVVDMSDIDFVDSSGLGTLVAIHQMAASRGMSFVLRSVPDRVHNLLTLTRLDRLLKVE